MSAALHHLTVYDRSLAPATEWACALPAWVFLRVRSGDGYLLQPDAPHMLRSGEVVVKGAEAAAVLRASQLAPLHIDYFFVQPDLLSGILNAFEIQHLQSQQTARLLKHIPPDEPLARQFAALTQPNGTDPVELRCQLLALVARLLRDQLPAQPAPPTGLTAEARVDRLLSQMPAAELLNTNAAALARRCGCSVRHFSRLFKRRFGVTLIQRQIALRLQKARQLLLETDDKIVDIALESGFQHLGLFTQMFKKQYRITPSEYRRRHQRR